MSDAATHDTVAHVAVPFVGHTLTGELIGRAVWLVTPPAVPCQFTLTIGGDDDEEQQE